MPNPKIIIKIILVTLVFTMLVPMVITEVVASANCTNDIKNQIQAEIDTLSTLENAPTIQETGQKNKREFANLKKNKINPELENVKNDLINIVKTKYKLNADVVEEYSSVFGNINTANGKITTRATVTKLTDYKDGAIDPTTFEYDVIFDKKTKKADFYISANVSK